MVFIVTLIALLIERFFDWSHLRHWYWFHAYERLIWKRLPHSSFHPYLVLAATILPLILLIGIIQILLQGVLYGFISVVFSVVILLYCFGPQNLWADAFACLNALANGDAHGAADKLKTTFGVTDSRSQPQHRNFLNHIFIEAERRVFGVLFWFLILGPLGAVLYRTVSLSADDMTHHDTMPELSQAARLVENILDWVPVRIFTFIFALGGHFVHVFNCWRHKVLQGLTSNEALLSECGVAALGINDKIPEDGSPEKHALSLIDRSFIIILILIALGVCLT